nr:MAG TPA: hypothetical protein [Caudoviricetes sp.]
MVTTVTHYTQRCVAKLLAPHTSGVYSFSHEGERKASSPPH